MRLTEITPVEKFRRDVQRYLLDYQLSHSIKLLFIIDFWPIILLRLEEFSVSSGRVVRFLLKILLLFFRPLIQGMTGTRIFFGAQIGGGLLLHTSVGIVVTAKAVIGENCTLFSGSSVVHRADGTKAGAPVIGNGVKLMSGCKIIGPVNIGDKAIIGANAVVLRDVPACSLAVGVPVTIKIT